MDESEKFQLLLKNLNLNAKHLASAIGVQPSTISNIIAGRNKPSLDVIQKILAAFPLISPSWLILGVEPFFISSTPNHQNLDPITGTPSQNRNKQDNTVPTDFITPNNSNLFHPPLSSPYSTTQNEPYNPNTPANNSGTNDKYFEKKIDKIIILYSDKTYEIK